MQGNLIKGIAAIVGGGGGGRPNMAQGPAERTRRRSVKQLQQQPVFWKDRFTKILRKEQLTYPKNMI